MHDHFKELNWINDIRKLLFTIEETHYRKTYYQCKLLLCNIWVDLRIKLDISDDNISFPFPNCHIMQIEAGSFKRNLLNHCRQTFHGAVVLWSRTLLMKHCLHARDALNGLVQFFRVQLCTRVQKTNFFHIFQCSSFNIYFKCS